jgi:hypothetical protein
MGYAIKVSELVGEHGSGNSVFLHQLDPVRFIAFAACYPLKNGGLRFLLQV